MAKPWYSRYSGDYLRKTGHLPLIQHGAYTLMLDWYYANRKPLPTDVVEIYRLCSAVTEAERQAVDRVLRDFFELRDDGYHNERADHELAAADRASEHGKKGASARHLAQGLPEGCPNDAQGLAPQPQPLSQPQTTSTSPDGEGSPPAPCPHGAIIDLYHRHLPMGTRVQMNLWKDARAQRLTTRWREDKTRQTLQWWDKFFDYCAKSPFLTGKTSSPNRRAFLVSLDWILKAENFTKILEGKYER